MLVCVGRLSRQKNHTTLLHALRQLPDVHLALVGDGELLSDLQQMAKDLEISSRVHFTGEVSSGDVFSCLKAADVFTLPSLWEAMPLAVLEAMAAGIPIVASDIPAMREVLGETALLVPPRDAHKLANAVARILEAPALADRLRSSAMKRARVFSVSTMTDEYQRIITSLSAA